MIRALIDPSPDALICQRLTARFGRDGAKQALAAICKQFTNVELAALAARWETWARPKQLPPPDWQTWGNLTARGWGKTSTIANIITREVQAGRVKTLIMSAQNLTKTVAVQVEGLIAAAPPWFKPEHEATRERLTWPNGARAYYYTPEVPDAIRSENADMAWLSEVQSWSPTTREEAYSNFVFATRRRDARLMWDATPKRGHPILKRFLARAEKHPTKHIVVRGAIYENPHIAASALDTMELDYGGTQKGREEMLGEMLGDEDAIFRQAWFDDARRGVPDRLARRILAIDPAITSDARHSDSTGIVEMGLGHDGQVYAIANHSGKHRPEEWAAMVIDAYVSRGMDLLWIETNRGGDSHAGLLRVIARARGLELRELAKDEAPMRVAGKVNMRGINTRRQKVVRAEGAAALCERGRVTFAKGLDALEEQLCGFDGSDGKSDDAIDAFVHGCHELAGLGHEVIDHGAAFRGLTEANRQIRQPSHAGSVARSFGGGGGGGRI